MGDPAGIVQLYLQDDPIPAEGIELLGLYVGGSERGPVTGTTVVVHYGFAVESMQGDIGWLWHKSILGRQRFKGKSPGPKGFDQSGSIKRGIKTNQ